MPEARGRHARSLFRRTARGIVCCVAVLALAVALGLAWPALSVRMPSAEWWFALPVGIIMGTCIPSCVGRARVAAMILAAGGTLLCVVYAKCLHVGLELAAVMGLPYLHTLHRAGAGMLLTLAHLSLTPRVIVACIAATLIALIIAIRKTGPRAMASGKQPDHPRPR